MAILRPKEMAERLGVTVLTLQRWDNNGTLKAYCTPMIKALFLMKQLLILEVDLIITVKNGINY